MSKRFFPYDLPLALFIGSALISLFPAYDPLLGLPTLVAYGIGFLIYWFLSRRAPLPKLWDYVAMGLSAITALIALYFITQSGRFDYGDKIQVLNWLANLIARFTPNLAIWQPLANTIATFLEGPFFLIFGLMILETKRTQRRVFFGIWVLTGFALLMTASRGAWMAVLGAALLWAALYWKPARYLLFAGVAGLAALIVFVIIRGDITAISQISVASQVLGPLFIRPDRLEVYRNSLSLISDVPFTGIGLGRQFSMVYARYELFIPNPYLHYSHNLFLEIWLEQGLLGILAFLWLVAAIFTSASANRHNEDHVRFESTWIGISAILLHGFTDASQTQSLWCWLPFFAMLGLNAALLLRSEPHSNRPLFKLLPISASFIFLIAFLINYWPLPVAIQANQGSLIQTSANLSPGLKDKERAARLEQSTKLFLHILDSQPKNRTANQRLGIIYLDEQKYEQAVKHLEKAIQVDRLTPGIQKSLGLSNLFSGKIDQAEILLKDQINILNELNSWGDYYDQMNQPELSSYAYTLSLRFNPDQPRIKTTLEKILHPDSQTDQ